MNIAFLFPGQGSQQVGMGIDVAEKYPEAARIFQQANQILGSDLYKLIEKGPAEQLKLTVNTQPAVVTASIAMLEVLRQQGVRCDSTAGHSVGEYTALYCAGVLNFEDCLTLARKRGEYMQQAGEKYPGTLAAIIGLEPEEVEKVCSQVKGTVVVANLNCPGQVVISGEVEAVQQAGKIASGMGARKVIPLQVSGAFHSPLMNEAAEKLAKDLDAVEFSDPQIPVYCNVTGERETDGDRIRQLMKKQVISRVLWEKSIRRMMEDNLDTFVEIGPGRTLAGMMRRINRRTRVLNFEDASSLEKVLSQIGSSSLV